MSHCGTCHHVGHNLAALFGRIIIALLFLVAAAGKIQNWDVTINTIKEANFAWPEALASIAVVLEILGGLSLFFGYRTRFGALLLIIVIIAASLLFHDFWNAAADKVLAEKENFARNLFYLGALLLVTAFGAGRYSVDGCREARCCAEKAETESGTKGGCCR